MIYPYIVNKNGIWYAAGEDVPENNLKEVEKSTSSFLKIQICLLRNLIPKQKSIVCLPLIYKTC